MTKRRPSWSKWLRRAAAFACSLLLLHCSPTLWAAGKKPSAPPATAKPGKRPVLKPLPPKARKPIRHPSARPAVGAAEMIGGDSLGLHGSASFYGYGFQGRKTSTGEAFDVHQFTAASNHFPLGSKVVVRRLDSERCAIVKVNDRMHTKHRRRVIDVSRSVAEHLDMLRAGVVLVRVAPLKAYRHGDELSACPSAPAPGAECPGCGLPPRLPEFGSAPDD